MKILALDTSARHLSIAVGDDKKVVISRTISGKNDLSQSIARYIEETLKKTGLKLKTIDAVTIGLGPGSFTGLRIGLACAKALSMSLQIPIIGVSSLDALAEAFAKEKKNVCVLVDARRNLFYAAIYAYRDRELRRSTEYLLAPLAEILKKLTGEVIVVGDGIMLAKDAVKKSGVRADFAPEKYWKAQAKFLLKLGAERLKSKKIDRAESLTPIYLYPEDCQVQKR